jgi:hypothetical protein
MVYHHRFRRLPDCFLTAFTPAYAHKGALHLLNAWLSRKGASHVFVPGATSVGVPATCPQALLYRFAAGTTHVRALRTCRRVAPMCRHTLPGHRSKKRGTQTPFHPAVAVYKELCKHKARRLGRLYEPIR